LFIRASESKGELLISWGSKPGEQCVLNYALPIDHNPAQSGYLLMKTTCSVR
jgi:outer membrane usher protein FimD/PapC